MVAFATFLNKLNYYLLSVFYVLFSITLAPLESDIVVGGGGYERGLAQGYWNHRRPQKIYGGGDVWRGKVLNFWLREQRGHHKQ